MFVYIEGNIAAGKTTLLDELEQRGYKVLREPIDHWSFLKQRYENPKRWTFTLQIEILASMAAQRNQHPSELVFLERSFESWIIFNEVALEAGDLSYEEFAIISRLASVMPTTPSRTICINTPPEECYTRLMLRNRAGESQITLDYLHDVHKRHENVNNWDYVSGTQSIESVADKVLSIVKHDTIFTEQI